MKPIEKPILFIGKIVGFIILTAIPLYLFVFSQIVARGIDYYLVEYIGIAEFVYDEDELAEIREQIEYEREERELRREDRDDDYAYDDYDNDYDYDLSR
ncbi:MAG: hypothetical protein AAF244_00335 [Pseudomonadota bacterium]